MAQGVCAPGKMVVIRVDHLKPGGSFEGLRKALADHAAWYRAHGYTNDRFEWGRYVELDPLTRAARVSSDKIITFHYAASIVPRARHDAQWDAYVAEYDANVSTMTTTLSCMED